MAKLAQPPETLLSPKDCVWLLCLSKLGICGNTLMVISHQPASQPASHVETAQLEFLSLE